jgi:hypothetical protein
MAFNEIAEGTYILAPESVTKVEKLPVGTYTISIHPDFGYIVQRTTDFTLPEKIYGDNSSLVATMEDRFLNERIGKVTTAALSGLKGSGKTLAAKQLSTSCLKKGISTFLVSRPFAGQGFNAFLTALQEAQENPIIVLIDEFEKIYTEQSDINALLTLLDGTASLHMMVLLTMNTSLDERRFEFFKNRPGRAYFNKHFETCPEKVIREYCEDNLQYPDKINEVINFSYRFQAFTLDLLTTLVKEINLTKGKLPLTTICDYANIKPDLSGSSDSYVVRCFDSTTQLPLSAEALNNFRVDYEFAEDILRYRTAQAFNWISKEDDAYKTIRDLVQASLAEGSEERLGGMYEISPGVTVEVEYRNERLDEKDEDGSSKTKRVFSRYKVMTSCAIKHPDDPEAEIEGSEGTIDFPNRKITFELKELNLALILESRNRRVDESRRLVL